MTVQELIEQLEAMDPEAVVYIDHVDIPAALPLEEAEWLILDQIVKLS